MRIDPGNLTRTLRELDVWLMPQPRQLTLTGTPCDLKHCNGVYAIGTQGVQRRLAADTRDRLRNASGVSLRVMSSAPVSPCLVLELCRNGRVRHRSAIRDAHLKGLGDQGYVLHIDSHGVHAAATGYEGLVYATRTLAQIAAGRTVLPGISIRDWPAMRYRGIHYDISRGQMPTDDTLRRLCRLIADVKMNLMELYIEDTFQWRSHPTISAPEAITAEQAKALFRYGTGLQVEIHPMLQVLGHFGIIGSKPGYQQFMVPGGATVDIRKPEALQFMRELVTEIVEAFPGRFLNVDITEIDDHLFAQTGTDQEQLTELILQYVMQLREWIRPYGTRLMIAQCQLSAAGSLAGIGSVIDRLPKDIAIGSYYTAEFYGGWERDYPRLQALGIDFMVQAWIDSHGHIMPHVRHSMDFSDITVSRGLQHGACGSVTCDWGDAGHYHFAGLTWYPLLYHGVSAWCGGAVDRDYFNQAYCRQLFGMRGDAIARAIQLAGDINAQPMVIRTESGETPIPPYAGNSTFGRYYYEFFGDPFTDPRITEIADPLWKGREILAPANRAAALLSAALTTARSNRDNLEQLLFAARNYQAMGQKLVLRAHELNPEIPREQVRRELQQLVDTYRLLRADFARLWLAENRDNAGYRELLSRYDRLIDALQRRMSEWT